MIYRHSLPGCLIFCGVTGALQLALLCAGLGLLLSQYYPVFGGLEKFAQPWDKWRLSLIPIHLFSFGIAGFLIGAFFGPAIGFAVCSKYPPSDAEKAARRQS